MFASFPPAVLTLQTLPLEKGFQQSLPSFFRAPRGPRKRCPLCGFAKFELFSTQDTVQQSVGYRCDLISKISAREGSPRAKQLLCRPSGRLVLNTYYAVVVSTPRKLTNYPPSNFCVLKPKNVFNDDVHHARTTHHHQVSNLEWLETGNIWLDLVLYSIAPIVIHIAVPDALNFSLSTLAFGVIFSASIPLYRRWGGMAQQRLRANGVSLYYRVRNAYETTIRFEKEVRIYVCAMMVLRAALRCAAVYLLFGVRLSFVLSFRILHA